MNLQEAFNVIYAHAQKEERSVAPDACTCMYRGPEGKKCFVGILIPDDKCPEDIDSGNWPLSKIITDKLIDIDDPQHNVRSQLRDLQMIHDNINPSDWNANLQKFAELNALTVPQC